MKVRTTLYLLLTVCALGLFAWMTSRHDRDGTQSLGADGPLLETVADDVAYMSYRWPDRQLDCVRREDGWFIEHPIEARADDALMTRILSILEAQRRLEVITAEQMAARALSRSDYGLDPAELTVVVGSRLRRESIAIGATAPIGSNVYVRLSEGTDTIATGAAIRQVIPPVFGLLRDRRLLHGEVAQTSRLELHTASGFIRLTREADGWTLRQPVSARADAARVEEILEALYALKVTSFVWDRPSDGAKDDPDGPSGRFAAYGLGEDQAAVRLRVWVGDDDLGRELILGKPVDGRPGLVYARRPRYDSVYGVTKEVMPLFDVVPNDLRDRYVFPPAAVAEVQRMTFESGDERLVFARTPEAGWVVAEPVNWKADEERLQALLADVLALRALGFEDPSQTNLVASGLESPDMALSLATANDAMTLRLVRQEAFPDSVAARFDEGDVLMRLDSSALPLLDISLSALSYRDRTMLDLPLSDVQRITWSRDGASRSVVRLEQGGWAGGAPDDGDVDQQIVRDTLFFASNLRAASIESYRPISLVAYGLDKPQASVSFGLTGDGGILKTLLLGQPVPGRGIYAMVQGQELVFVLATHVVDRMMRNPMTP